MYRFFIIFFMALSITFVTARPQQELLAEGEYHQYGLDLPKLKDELTDEGGVGDDKLFLQHVLSKRKASATTVKNHPMEESSTETATLTATSPETTATNTTERATSATYTEKPTTSTTLTADPYDNTKNLLNSAENTDQFAMVIYPSSIFQQPVCSYYPVSYYNFPSRVAQMTQTLPGMKGMAQSISAISYPMAGLRTALPHLPQNMLTMPRMSHMPALNSFSQYPTQFLSPVYSPYRVYKK